jgi:DNA-binding transcriptional LysR family regulator
MLRSFSAAARQLGRSPQAITRAVASLEARLDTRLLARTTRSVSLTVEGARYLERSRRALAELDALETPSTEMRGTLTLTAPVLFGQLHVLPLVTTFLETHADVQIKLSLLDRVVSLADEGVDLAIRIGELPDSALLARHVGDVRTVLVASPAYLDRAGAPRLVESLPNHTCIAFSGATPIVDRWTFGKRSIAVTPRLIVNSAQAAIDAAVAGLGITRVLSYQVARLVEANDLRIALASHEPPTIPVHLVRLPCVQTRIGVQRARRRIAVESDLDTRGNVRCTASR